MAGGLKLKPNATNTSPCNHSNPFSFTTAMSVYLEHAHRVSLVIYDVKGAQVYRAFSSLLPSGMNVLPCSAKDLPSGIYLCRLRTLQDTHTQRLIIHK